MDALVSTLANGTPAPYGKACTNCVRAKCRCIYRVGGPDCERCHRLAKECIASVSVRKRNARRPHVSRAAQLEEKLDDLFSLLRNQTAPTSTAHAPQAPGSSGVSVDFPGLAVNGYPLDSQAIDPGIGTPAPSHHSGGSHGEDDIFVPARTRCKPNKTRAITGPDALLAHVFQPQYALEQEYGSEHYPLGQHQPTAHEAEQNLEAFRKCFLVFLPFAYIPPTMTARQLQQQNPFFWYNIMAVTCKNADRQLLMSDLIKKYMAQKVVIENEKSMDLLWGLVTFMSWAQYQRKEKPCFSLLTSLAKSLIFDFCLNKPPRPPAAAICLEGRVDVPAGERTMDERRAVLALFYITSQISQVMKRIDALTWTPSMDDCLQVLTQTPECEGDELLVALVKIQLIVEQLTRAVWQSPDNTPPPFFALALKTQLLELKTQFPIHIQENSTIRCHLYYTELAILQSSQAKRKTPSAFAPDLHRYEGFEASLVTVKRWFEVHFSFPIYMHVGLPFIHWCNLGHCLVTLTSLAFEIDDPAWDRRAVKERLDIFNIIDTVIRSFDEAAESQQRESGPCMSETVYAKCARLLRKTKMGWLSGAVAAGHGLSQGMSVVPGDTYGGLGHGTLDSVLSQFPVDQTDDNWMGEFFELSWEP
ncbi:hypothetical protein OQA88_8230 [Cercophora sp. LCS_1]